MDMLSRAMQVVGEAESRLRELIEQATREQRYADVAAIATVAEGLSKLSALRTTSATRREASPPVRRAPKLTSSNGIKKYPRFEREDDRLVKIGWSKKARSEYEHRAPRVAVVAFVRHLMSQVLRGKIFAVEDLLPVPDTSGGELPAYQVYLTLAWLRRIEAIEKKGRDGYVLRHDSTLDGELDELWNALPVRSA